jgi:hypothetical protein
MLNRSEFCGSVAKLDGLEAHFARGGCCMRANCHIYYHYYGHDSGIGYPDGFMADTVVILIPKRATHVHETGR